MIATEERLSHLVSLVVDGIWNDDLVDYADDDAAMRIAKRAATEFLKEQTSVDEAVKAKIVSLKRQVLEGTPEWDIMYSKYYDEELKKRGFEK